MRTASGESTADSFPFRLQEDFHKARPRSSPVSFISLLLQIGGLPALLKYLIKKGLIVGDLLTVTGKTLAENVADAVDLETTWDKQDVVRPLERPIKSEGHIAILRGNLAPDTAVACVRTTNVGGDER